MASRTASPNTSGNTASACADARTLTCSLGLLAWKSRDHCSQNAGRSKSGGRVAGSLWTLMEVIFPTRKTVTCPPWVTATRYHVPALFTRPSGSATRGAGSPPGRVYQNSTC